MLPGDPWLMAFMPCMNSPIMYQVWSVWPTEHDTSGSVLFLRPSYKRSCGFCLTLSPCVFVCVCVFLIIHFRPAAMLWATLWRSLGHEELRTPANIPGLLPTATWMSLGEDPPGQTSIHSMRQPQPTSWLQLHERPWTRTTLLSHSWISQPQ